MDTKFWGPGAWKLLHMCAFHYNPETQKKFMITFIYTLPFVLPCKFCRKSLTEFYKLDPPTFDTRELFSEWLWRIHNYVNNKLREQGLSSSKNPTFLQIKTQYEKYLQEGCSKTQFPGWELLFCILDNHPFSKEGKSSKPFDIIEGLEKKYLTNVEKNQYNILSSSERLGYISTFFKVLPEILPYYEWTKSWKSTRTIMDIYEGRRKAIKWLYSIRSKMEEDFDFINKETYFGVCSIVASHRSGCSKKTCRKTRKKRG